MDERLRLAFVEFNMACKRHGVSVWVAVYKAIALQHTMFMFLSLETCPKLVSKKIGDKCSA